jgi:hypothetical protein
MLVLSAGVTTVHAGSSRPEKLCVDSGNRKIVVGFNGKSALRHSEVITYFFPIIVSPASCGTPTGESYDSVTIMSEPTDRPAETHPDLNLAIRDYAPTTGAHGFVSYGGPSEATAPQLYTLFGDNRTPTFRSLYRVYYWDWDVNQRNGFVSEYPVTLVGMGVARNEIIHVPSWGRNIGAPAMMHSAMVLYAADSRLTLKYTREDDVVKGYTIHIENICVDPNLLSLYRTLNAAGRSRLPALYPGQGLGRAMGAEIGVAVRDSGTFMDPRSRDDWWIGR